MAHKYSLRTYEYLSSVRTKRSGYQSFCMQLVGDKLYVNRTSLDADAGNYLLMEIDEKTGVQTDSCLKADDYNRGWNFALRLPFSFFYSKIRMRLSMWKCFPKIDEYEKLMGIKEDSNPVLFFHKYKSRSK